MADMQFTKATKRRSKARVTIDGPAGAGKTYTALIAATVLAQGGKVAVIDTERGSASLYSDEFAFDVVELQSFDPRLYVQAIHLAEKGGYAVIVIDSLSHAWQGVGGALEQVDNIAARSQSRNSYFAWRDVTPVHNDLVDAMLQSPCHVVTTMRSKMEYVVEEINGKQVPRKIGLAPIQRAGTEYEFTIVADMDVEHKLIVSKSRCKALDSKVQSKPGREFWQVLADWLNSGEAEAALESPLPPAQPSAPATAAAPAASQPAGNGNGRRLADTDKLIARYDQLVEEAVALGISIQLLTPGALPQQIIEAGKALKARIDHAKATPQPEPAAAPATAEMAGPPSTHDKLVARWVELCDQARALGLDPQPLGAAVHDPDMIKARGIALGKQVKEAAFKIYALAQAHGRIPEQANATDADIIRIAIELTASQPAGA